jgi:hypothetical protein
MWRILRIQPAMVLAGVARQLAARERQAILQLGVKVAAQ